MTDALHIGDAQLRHGHAVEVLGLLPESFAHCCVSSPPYWGLRDYGLPPVRWADGWEGCLGLEPTPEMYVAHVVEVFEAVRRVLRPEGTLWLNLGDCYASGGRGGGGSFSEERRAYAEKAQQHGWRSPPAGLKPKDMVGIPWRVAFALQAAGWWLRSDIIWAKPNPMPESVTDRPTKAHEYLFLLAKSEAYYYDDMAVRERCTAGDVSGDGPDYQPPGGGPAHKGLRRRAGNKARTYRIDAGGLSGSLAHQAMGVPWEDLTGFRNRRSVWTVTTQPFREAHFATFPPRLIEPCILAGTSERGCCPTCGAPWTREVERTFVPQEDVAEDKGIRGADEQKPLDESNSWQGYPRGTTKARTTGWKPSCTCSRGGAKPVPCTVLDPFNGAGTTGLVSLMLGRRYTGVEMNPEYLAMSERRLRAATTQADLFRRPAS